LTDLQKLIEELEVQVKERHAGEVPETFYHAPPEESKDQPKPVRVFVSQVQMCDIKGLNENMDGVSCLMTVCREQFQLAPNFVTTDGGAEQQSRVRFTTACKFDTQIIATCCGQNKKESKGFVAKLALFKVAPIVYRSIFGDEAPPEDSTDAYLQMSASKIKDADLCLKDNQLLDYGCQSEIFRNYTLFKCL
jgi:hypothetical protein